MAQDKIENNELISPIQQAIENNQISLLYQKRICLQTSETDGLEVFSRITLTNGDVLSPASFLSILETQNLDLTFSLKVIDKAFNECQMLLCEKHIESLCFNMRLETLTAPSFIDDLIALNAQYNIPPNTISFDISFNDDHLKNLSSSTITRLNKLKDIGCEFNLEVSYFSETVNELISKFSFKELKTTPQLTTALKLSSKKTNDLEKLMYIAAIKSIDITAVGIENHDDFVLINHSGISHGQGYYIARDEPIYETSKDLLTTETIYAEHKETDDRPSVLCYIKDEAFSGFLSEGLLQKTEVLITDDLNITIAALKERLPDIIILEADDILIGSDEKKEVFSNFLNDNPSRNILLIDPQSNEDIKLEAFSIGVTDILQYPVHPVEFLRKIDKILSNRDQYKALENQINDSNELIMQTMKDSSGYASMVNFMKDVTQSQTEQNLASSLFNYLSSLGIKSSITFRSDNQMVSIDSTGLDCSPSEINAYELLFNRGRLYEFGNRLMVNDEHVSFLIKNLSTDPHERGRVRDYVATLVECLESKYRTLLYQRSVQNSVVDISSISNDASLQIEKYKQRMKTMMELISEEISSSFHILDLSMEQEDYFTTLIQKIIKTHTEDTSDNNQIADRIKETLNDLEKSRELINVEVIEQNSDSDGMDDSSDIELF